jgi:hypothetical protein
MNETTLDTGIVARLERSEEYFAELLARGSWRPRETRQQVAVALVDKVSDTSRALFLQAIFGVSVCPEPTCERVLRVHHVRKSWDLQLFCDNEDCDQHDLAALNIELKPEGAPPHFSFAPRERWLELLSDGVISKTGTVRLFMPAKTCRKGTCQDCEHLTYRDSPVLPQVAVAANGSPVLVLTDMSGSVDQIWDTERHGYRVHGVDVLRIADGLASLAAALDAAGETMSATDRRIVANAVTALWMRTPIADFHRLAGLTALREIVSAGSIEKAANRRG